LRETASPSRYRVALPTQAKTLNKRSEEITARLKTFLKSAGFRSLDVGLKDRDMVTSGSLV